MLRTNLASRPFYNRRAIHLVLGGAALVVAALTIANVLAFSLLTTREREVAGDVMQAEARTLELQRETRRLRQGLDHAQLEAIATAARHANRLIDRRVFSWTGLLAVVEATLPDEMRVTAMTPETDAEGRLVVAIAVVARRAEEVEAFLTALAGSGRFTDAVALHERATDDGLLEVTIQARHATDAVASAAPGAGPAGPAGAGEGAPW